MPIEIRELIIKATVGNPQNAPEHGGERPQQQAKPPALTAEERKEIIEECLERLRRELEARQQW